jgi:hypothetical protein
MTADVVSIYNLALNAVGKRDNLQSTQDKDRGAEVCNLWYPIIRDTVFRAAPWPSAKAFFRLNLLKERAETNWSSGDPEPGFRFAYGVPADMIYPRYLTEYGRFTVSTYPDNRQAINTNVQNAVLVYNKRNEAAGTWDVSLKMAIVYGLAANICMPLTGKPARAQTMIDNANNLIFTARQNEANTDENLMDTLPDWITARGFTSPIVSTRYYYPWGPALTIESPANVS